MACRCDLRYSISPFGAIAKICFIFINHIDLTLRSWFHFILINMIYTIESDFRPDSKWKNMSHCFAILFWRSDCYLATGPKFCAIQVTNYWAHITFPQIYNVMMYSNVIDDKVMFCAYSTCDNTSISTVVYIPWKLWEILCEVLKVDRSP